MALPLETIAQLLARVPEARRNGHPLFRLAVAADANGVRRARRVEQALVRVRKSFPAFASSKEQLLVEDSDLHNAAAILGEVRALSDLASVFGSAVETPSSGSDFLVTAGRNALRCEVVTPSGSTKERELLIATSTREGVTATETAIAPFGFPEAGKPGDTVQGNAVSRLASLKQKEHQADSSAPSVLWVDLDNDRAFPIPLGVSQAQPFTSGQEELVSGAAWWANYGARGDSIFDRWSLTTGERRSYTMEFSGRFQRSSRYAGVVYVFDGQPVLHEHPDAATPLGAHWIVSLLSLPGASFEHWWTNWPIPGSLVTRVELARQDARALLGTPHPASDEMAVEDGFGFEV